MRRLSVACSLVVLAACAHADRFITIPTGTKVPSQNLKASSYLWGDDQSRQVWFGYGLNKSIEIGTLWFKSDGKDAVNTIDASFNLVTPITDTSPGVSFGFLDAANISPSGRTFYMATTFRLGNDGEYNQDVPTELHFGFWSRKSGLMFVGASLPLSPEVRLVAEHNSHSLTAGVDIRPVKQVSIKLLTREGRPSLGLAWTQKF